MHGEGAACVQAPAWPGKPYGSWRAPGYCSCMSRRNSSGRRAARAAPTKPRVPAEEQRAAGSCVEITGAGGSGQEQWPTQPPSSGCGTKASTAGWCTRMSSLGEDASRAPVCSLTKCVSKGGGLVHAAPCRQQQEVGQQGADLRGATASGGGTGLAPSAAAPAAAACVVAFAGAIGVKVIEAAQKLVSHHHHLNHSTAQHSTAR